MNKNQSKLEHSARSAQEGSEGNANSTCIECVRQRQLTHVTGVLPSIVHMAVKGTLTSYHMAVLLITGTIKMLEHF